MPKSILVVGAGFYGAVCARELFDLGHSVHVIEKRVHIAGNCYTRPKLECGCHEHVYGPHIFHTNSKKIWDYISRFTEWTPYVHRPKARYKGVLYSLPVNLRTFQQIYGVSTPEQARRKLESVRHKIESPDNLEDWCLSEIGPDIYERLIRGYTIKQWKKDPRELPPSIIKRIPVRLNDNDNYFDDRFQGIPKNGYTSIFERLLEGIPVDLNTDFLQERDYWINRYDHVIYSGPVDALFNYESGTLEYRSLRFNSVVEKVADFQGVSQINETDESVPYTRVIEHKHFNGDFSKPASLITYEYPEDWSAGKTEYYPIETAISRSKHRAYIEQLDQLGLPITAGGRLGDFRYYDMHQVIGSALRSVQTLAQSWK